MLRELFSIGPGRDTIELAQYIANKLHEIFLEPIKERVYQRTANKGEPIITLDQSLFLNLIKFVKTGKEVLNFFKDKTWWHPLEIAKYKDLDPKERDQAIIEFNKKERKRKVDAKYCLYNMIVDRFFYTKRASLAGMDLHDPFAYWATELYWRANLEELEKIDEIAICEHGDILFKIQGKLIQSYKDGYGFRCGQCIKPRDIYRITPVRFNSDG